eukprot:TRINITY_DN2598_c2_g1_i2.p1 TRINITY_DN2598_c2_g1~~TRINITY_DN2598_c2_g1_i2.p1  ORF type:complete len:376 (-),score=164.17 TRINITY_DN2598_c2_g1_i2:133-1260(-)
MLRSVKLFRALGNFKKINNLNNSFLFCLKKMSTQINTTNYFEAKTFISPVSGITISTKIWGKEENPIKVIGIHGWLDNAATWDGLGPYIAQNSSFCFMCLDLPGHGRSGHHPKGWPYHFVDYVSEIVGLVDLLGWESYSIIGHSLGAGISTFVSAVDERVKCAVFIEGLGPWATAPEKQAQLLKQALISRKSLNSRTSDNNNNNDNSNQKLYPSLQIAAEKLQFNSLTFLKHKLEYNSALSLVSWSTKPIYELNQSNEQQNQIIQSNDKEPIGFVFMHDINLRANSFFRYSEDQVASFLVSIKCPLFCIIGEFGNAEFLSFYPARKAKLVAPVEELRVTNAHHHLHLDSPQLIQQSIIDFLIKNNNLQSQNNDNK